MNRNKINKAGVRSKAFRYGTVSAVLSILLIAAIILVNVIFTMLADKYLWQIDMTKDRLYTLSDSCIEALADVSADVTVYFCDEPDDLDANETTRIVHHTALELREKMPNIHIEYLDIYRNPSSVERFRRSEDETFHSTTVIFESGTEWTTNQLRSFYVFNSSTDSTPWAYKGEQTYTAAILSITRTEAPIACITQNHGEIPINQQPAFVEILTLCGYRVMPIDLAVDEIPEDCRLVVINGPTDDFLVKDGISTISEIDKLDRFLDGLNAMMVFMSPSSPVLPNLEEYLEEWGIKFLRQTDELANKTYPCFVKDMQNSLTNDGHTIVGEYATDGLGASIHKDMRASGFPARVIFPNVMPIVYPDSYKVTTYIPEDNSASDTTTQRFTYGYYSSSAGVVREAYDVFTSYDSAELIANGMTVPSATSDFRLMSVTREQRMVDNEHSDNSYVWACGTTDFVSQKLLMSNTYGNSDLMMYSMHTMSKEYIPVGLEYKIFDDTTIDGITTAEADQYTWTLILVPPVIMFAVGTVIIIRRKYS